MRAVLRWVIPIGLAVLVVLVLAVKVTMTDAFDQAARTPVTVATATPGKTRSVLLFFADPDGEGLVARRADIPAAPDPGSLATQTLTTLLAGPAALPAPQPSPAPISAIPAGVELRALFLDGKGTAIVDLGHLAEKLPGGTEAEVLALWSVVDTLAFNFPADARRVRILVDGHEVDTAGGHVALDLPLTPRRDLVVGDLPAAAGSTPATPAPTEAAVLAPEEGGGAQ